MQVDRAGGGQGESVRRVPGTPFLWKATLFDRIGRTQGSDQVKLKDYVTLGSLAVALYSVDLAFQGRLERASVMVLLAWGFDALDGLVARLTRTGNRFGANLDDLVDHFAYTVAPAFVVFNAYAPYGEALAFALLLAVVGVGTIRLARSMTTPLSFPGYWIGLPRPAFGFMLVFLLNSSLYQYPMGRYLVVGLMVLMAGLSLTRLPYRNHKKRFRPAHTIALVATLLTCIALYPWGQMWNGAVVLGTIYLFAPWIGLSKTGRRTIEESLAAVPAGV
jgi:CDP-diacylglycerol---serine O-phosphatidyltransferase